MNIQQLLAKQADLVKSVKQVTYAISDVNYAIRRSTIRPIEGSPLLAARVAHRAEHDRLLQELTAVNKKVAAINTLINSEA